MIWAQPGDILLYFRAPNLGTRLIQVGEELEDGVDKRMAYHVAVAMDQYTKIEANGHSVADAPIDYANCRVFRPPILSQNIHNGLHAVRKLIGQRYDWVLILDDALRYLSHDRVHLPVGYVRSEERRGKVCSSLVSVYLRAAAWEPAKALTRNASPQDDYLLLRAYEVGCSDGQ